MDRVTFLAGVVERRWLVFPVRLLTPELMQLSAAGPHVQRPRRMPGRATCDFQRTILIFSVSNQFMYGEEMCRHGNQRSGFYLKFHWSN